VKGGGEGPKVGRGEEGKEKKRGGLGLGGPTKAPAGRVRFGDGAGTELRNLKNRRME